MSLLFDSFYFFLPINWSSLQVASIIISKEESGCGRLGQLIRYPVTANGPPASAAGALTFACVTITRSVTIERQFVGVQSPKLASSYEREETH